MRSNYLLPLICLLFYLFVPLEARADGISIPIFLASGFMVFAPITLFIALAEAAIIFKPLRISFFCAFKLMLLANIFSMLSGIPVKIINMFFYEQVRPVELYEYFTSYPYFVAIGTLFYFVVTVIVEYLYLHHICRKNTIEITWKKLAQLVLLANVATYAVMAPLNYYMTKPSCNISEFTRDSSWAQKPVSKVYYIDPASGCLASVMTDGSKREVMGKEPITKYHIDGDDGKRYISKEYCSFDANAFSRATAYLGLGSSIYIENKGKKIIMAVNPGLLHLGRRLWSVALLPNGKELVFSDKHHIYLMDMDAKKVGLITSGKDFLLLTPLFLEQEK